MMTKTTTIRVVDRDRRILRRFFDRLFLTCPENQRISQICRHRAADSLLHSTAPCDEMKNPVRRIALCS
jgi:hypothetical protein